MKSSEIPFPEAIQCFWTNHASDILKILSDISIYVLTKSFPDHQTITYVCMTILNKSSDILQNHQQCLMGRWLFVNTAFFNIYEGSYITQHASNLERCGKHALKQWKYILKMFLANYRWTWIWHRRLIFHVLLYFIWLHITVTKVSIYPIPAV